MGALLSSLLQGLAMAAVFMSADKVITAVNRCTPDSQSEIAMVNAVKACHKLEKTQLAAPSVPLEQDERAKRALEAALADINRAGAPKGATGVTGRDLVEIRAALERAVNQHAHVYGFWRRGTYCSKIKTISQEGMDCLETVLNDRRRIFNDICNYAGMSDSPLCKAGFPEFRTEVMVAK